MKKVEPIQVGITIQVPTITTATQKARPAHHIEFSARRCQAQEQLGSGDIKGQAALTLELCPHHYTTVFYLIIKCSTYKTASRQHKNLNSHESELFKGFRGELLMGEMQKCENVRCREGKLLR